MAFFMNKMYTKSITYVNEKSGVFAMDVNKPALQLKVSQKHLDKAALEMP